MIDSLAAIAGRDASLTSHHAIDARHRPERGSRVVSMRRPGKARTKVKVCGITNVDDAVMCEEEVVDAIGLVHVPGDERSLSLREINEICSTVGPWVTRVLICRPKGPKGAIRMLEDSGADVVQTYTMPPMFLSRLRDAGVRVIRVVGPGEDPGAYADHVDALVLDAMTSGDLSTMPVGSYRRAIMAGDAGLDGIVSLRPYGVDVSSAVESAVGRKDRDLVRSLVQRCGQ